VMLIFMHSLDGVVYTVKNEVRFIVDSPPQAVLRAFVGSHFFRMHPVCHSQICDHPLQIHVELQRKVRKLPRELAAQLDKLLH